MMSKITGCEKLKKMLMTKKQQHAEDFHNNMILGGLLLQRLSQKIVPVDTSALKNSGFTRDEGTGFHTQVIVGYTASYAIYVHERTDLRHKEGKQAKFLTGPLAENRKKILGVMLRGRRMAQ